MALDAAGVCAAGAASLHESRRLFGLRRSLDPWTELRPAGRKRKRQHEGRPACRVNAVRRDSVMLIVALVGRHAGEPPYGLSARNGLSARITTTTFAEGGPQQEKATTTATTIATTTTTTTTTTTRTTTTRTTTTTTTTTATTTTTTTITTTTATWTAAPAQ